MGTDHRAVCAYAIFAQGSHNMELGAGSRYVQYVKRWIALCQFALQTVDGLLKNWILVHPHADALAVEHERS